MVSKSRNRSKVHYSAIDDDLDYEDIEDENGINLSDLPRLTEEQVYLPHRRRDSKFHKSSGLGQLENFLGRFELPRKKFQAAVLSILSFGFLILIILKIGLAGKQCQSIDQLRDQKAIHDALKNETECKSSTGDPFPWQKYRLPGESIPSAYYLFFYPDPETNTFSGSVDIIFEQSAKGKYIALHARNLNIRYLSIFECNEYDVDCYGDNDSRRSQEDVEDFFVSCEELGMLVIKMRKDLLPGRKYNINIRYSSTLPVPGLILQKYQTGPSQFEQYLASDFMPNKARNVFPCFDEPEYQAKFTLEVVRRKDEKVFFNSGFSRKYPYAKNSGQTGKFGLSQAVQSHEVDTFETTEPVPLYSLGFVIGKFETTTISDGNFLMSTVSGISSNHALAFSQRVAKLAERLQVWSGKEFTSQMRFVLLPNYVKNSIFQPKGLALLPLSTFTKANYEIDYQIALELTQLMFHSGTIKWWDHLWQDAGIFQSIASSLLNDFDKNIILSEKRHEVFSHQSFFTLANLTIDSEALMSDAFSTFSSYRWGLVLNLFSDFFQMKFGSDLLQTTVADDTFENTVFENEGLIKKVKSSLGIDLISMATEWNLKDIPVLGIDTIGGKIEFTKSDNSLLLPVRYQVDETCCHEALIKEKSQAFDTGILPSFVASKGTLQLGYRIQYSTQVFDIIEKSLETAEDKNTILTEIERAMFFQDAFYFAKIGMDYII
ncbi:Oidioi.mRNA.OKI2018_I69.chr2.g7831.t1.cds [Oikopleura dioica]|uniref:Oidioi.mRNA.OKI2018_I69.chr2.g7831.t1.cds n=1 Tax=Oikopleura dioica TaxID=34765 RepID=A0ABN7TFZ4_OIKDI|nr:Oidioi.mRNA.OKI2018_I69.chr2.g7831.t1.cds [Oikopleura dioica]